METYRLNSKLIENDKEYMIQTTNDISLGLVETDVFVNGIMAESNRIPHPDDIKPEEVMSLVQTAHGEKKQEITELLQAIPRVLKSADPSLILQLALAFYHKRFIAESNHLFQEVLAVNPDSHEAYHYIGLVELQSGNLEASLGAMERAVTLKPEYADYRNALGEVYAENKMYRKAILEFQRAIDINLYYGEAYFNYALTLLINALEKAETDLFTNFMSKAFDYFTKASIINDVYKTVDFESGLRAIKNQQIEEAYNLFKHVKDINKERKRRKSAPFFMKNFLHPNWNTENAIVDRIRFLQQEIAKNPTYVDLHAELSRCYLGQAQLLWKKGIEQYKHTIELNPSFSKLHRYIEDAETVYEKINTMIKNIPD